jgi:hypothetical protein
MLLMRIRTSNVTYKDFYLLFQFALSAAEELLHEDVVVLVTLPERRNEQTLPMQSV